MREIDYDKAIDEITFKGLSTRPKRKLILLVTVIGLTLAASRAVKLIPENHFDSNADILHGGVFVYPLSANPKIHTQKTGLSNIS